MPTTTNPVVITSISGTGPLMALDLATVSAASMLPIVQAAMRVAYEWDNANINTPEFECAEDALTKLSEAANALDALLMPLIPGAPYTSRGDLMTTDTYPIIRSGEVHQIKADDLTPIELEAVHRWLSFHARVTENHAEVIKQRMAKLASESA